jgi:radical SAM superfamily enzyme YgiQ (UPF0313 family)
MKVLLINPPRFNGIPVIREDRCENADRDCVHPPTSLVYIAGILREKGFDVDLLDANAENLSYSFVEDWVHRRRVRDRRAEWIIFRSTPSTFYWDCKIVEIAKKYKIHTLMLNWNLHYVPEKVVQECPDLDVYLNEYHYEYAIPEILEKFPHYPRSNYPKTYDIPDPAWDLILNFKQYYTRTKWFSPWAVVRGSKGCPFICKFCIDANTGWYPRSPELIGDELEYLVKYRKVPYISFFDNTFGINADWCFAIASEIERRKLKFRWYVNSRADLICNYGLEFFKRMREVGLDGSSIGIEFGTDEMLEASGKGTTVEQGRESIRILHEAGVKSYVSCMIGYLGETEEQMFKTMEFIKETKPSGFQINTVVPYDGTELYDKASKQGLMNEEMLDWRGLSCVPTDTVPVKLSELGVDELIKLRKKMYRKIYFSSWLLSNACRLRSFSDFRLGLGYFLSGFGRLKNKVEFSH